MVAPGQGSRTATVLLPSPTQRLLPQKSGTSQDKTLGKQNLLKQDVKQATGKVLQCKSQQHVLTHGLHCIQHFSCDSPVRFITYSEAAAAFISLHTDNTVCFYTADGHKHCSSVHFPFMGLTPTKISDCLVGWGPGPILTLLDKELRPMDSAHDALDIRVCLPAEHSAELVTAGFGNVCVWSVRLMKCKVKIQEGLNHSTLTHMALAPPRPDRPHRAFVVCGQVVTVVDLDNGKVVDRRKNLCSRHITAVVFCSQLDCLIIASQDWSIRIWGPGWELRVAFVGHNGAVTSLFYCSELHTLLSASLDCTIRCWNVEEGDIVECVHTEQETPPLCIGGTRKGDTFFTFSQQGVDFWSVRKLYSLHCKLKGDKGAPLRQILTSPLPAPYPKRVLCVSGDTDITLVAAETGKVLTSFKTQQKILCADYCLHKEILLVLTEAGTVLQTNTLTNPVTLIEEWKGRGQRPWHQEDPVTEDDAQHLPVPGPACCLALYSYVAEPQEALEEWKSLQDRRGCSHRNKAALDDAKNRFLIILGQNGGCMSVLKLHDGKVLYRTPAHNGQRVTTIQVYPENGYLLSSGEDMTLVVWRVMPFVQECLSQQLSLHCGQSQVYTAALGPQLALTFQKDNSGIYSLMHFNLLSQSQIEKPHREGHLDNFTGLCVCPDLEVFVSSSLDGTVCIWNKENRLIRTFQLNAMPGCMAYGGFGGQLFIGIRGDLYRMNCAQFLPHKYQQMLLYTYYPEVLPDLPIIESTAKGSKRKIASTAENKEEELSTIPSNQILTEDVRRQKEYESIVTSNMDLSALLQGTVKCKKGKPPSTKQTKKEAFDRYMKIIYGLPHNIKIDLEDNSEPETFSFYSEPNVNKPCNSPTPRKETPPKPELNVPVKVKTEVYKKKKKTPETSLKPKTLVDVKPKPVMKVIPKKQYTAEKDEGPPEIISPIEMEPELPPPTPHRIRVPTALPPEEPSPEVPTFLKQFVDATWFRDVYPDKKNIPSTLTPEDFSLLLLACLNTCNTSSKMKVLAALQTLRSQELLKNADQLYQGLLDLLPKFVRPHMSPLDRTLMVEILNLLLGLKSAHSDFMKKLLTLLAYKKLGLRETLLRMLKALGVHEAEQWLLPELESWNSELQDQSDIWTSLHDKADCWLELWISKYQEYNRRRSTERPNTLNLPVATTQFFFPCMTVVLNQSFA
ncbi:WD repeat-containing protein 97 isoform X2 [Anabas testudineus]|uniref:WD repeat-containing protein 97 isoform X2 n=1 Tax=Anabas testudineus TaxID=64144 RepID=UPI000E455B87|nr:WD repeat-containing protein 97 isoform X2 [Anabas testudineus]